MQPGVAPRIRPPAPDQPPGASQAHRHGAGQTAGGHDRGRAPGRRDGARRPRARDRRRLRDGEDCPVAGIGGVAARRRLPSAAHAQFASQPLPETRYRPPPINGGGSAIVRSGIVQPPWKGAGPAITPCPPSRCRCSRVMSPLAFVQVEDPGTAARAISSPLGPGSRNFRGKRCAPREIPEEPFLAPRFAAGNMDAGVGVAATRK